MTTKTFAKIFLISAIAYVAVGMVTKQDALFTCSGQFDSKKGHFVNLRVHLIHPSPLFFWSRHGTLQTKRHFFIVKKDSSSFVVYRSGVIAGAFSTNLLEIFLQFPDDIFEGQCDLVD